MWAALDIACKPPPSRTSDLSTGGPWKWKTSNVWGLGLSQVWTQLLIDDREKSSMHLSFWPCKIPNLLLSGYYGTTSAQYARITTNALQNLISSSSALFFHSPFFLKTDLSHLILRSLFFLLVHLQNLRIYTPTTWSQVASHAVEKHPPHRQHNIQYERTTLSHRKCHSLRRIICNTAEIIDTADATIRQVKAIYGGIKIRQNINAIYEAAKMRQIEINAIP